MEKALLFVLSFLLCYQVKAQEGKNAPKHALASQKKPPPKKGKRDEVVFGVKATGGGSGGQASRSSKHHLHKRDCTSGSGICQESASRISGSVTVAWAYNSGNNVLTMTLDTNQLSRIDPGEDTYFQGSSANFPNVPWQSDFTLSTQEAAAMGFTSAVIIPQNCIDTVTYNSPTEAVLSFYNIYNTDTGYVWLGCNCGGKLTDPGLLAIFNNSDPQNINSVDTPLVLTQATFNFRQIWSGNPPASVDTFTIFMTMNYDTLVKHEPWQKSHIDSKKYTTCCNAYAYCQNISDPFVQIQNLMILGGNVPITGPDNKRNITITFKAYMP